MSHRAFTRLVLGAIVALLSLGGFRPVAAQSNNYWQQQQQRQQQQDQLRQQQQDQMRQQQQEQMRQQQQQAMRDQQRQQMQEQQRAQMRQQQQDQMRQQARDQQAQQMRDQQRQQQQVQQRQQTQQAQQQQQKTQMQQQQTAQRQQAQQQNDLRQQQQQQRQQQAARAAGTMQQGSNKPTGMMMAGGVAKMARPLTQGEIQRGFTGKVTADGRALIRFQNRVFTVPATRVSGYRPPKPQVAQGGLTTYKPKWSSQQQALVDRRIQALVVKSGNFRANGSTTTLRNSSSSTGAGGPSEKTVASAGGCNPPSSLSCIFNRNANQVSSVSVATRIEQAKAERLGLAKPMSGAAANMPQAFARSSAAPLELRPQDPAHTRALQTRDSYAPLASAYETKTVKEERFVRVHRAGNQTGSWILRESDIREPITGRRLSAEAIRDKFAINETPTHISDVVVPPNTRLRVGEVKGYEDWGNGGGTQYELKDGTKNIVFGKAMPLK